MDNTKVTPEIMRGLGFWRGSYVDIWYHPDIKFGVVISKEGVYERRKFRDVIGEKVYCALYLEDLEGIIPEEMSGTYRKTLRFWRKVRELEGLEENWDRRGAKKIVPDVIFNLIAIKEMLGEWDFNLWQISPGVNGDIFLNYKGLNCFAGIVLSVSGFSYFMETEDELEGQANEVFTPERVIEIMDRITYKNNDEKEMVTIDDTPEYSKEEIKAMVQTIHELRKRLQTYADKTEEWLYEQLNDEGNISVDKIPITELVENLRERLKETPTEAPRNMNAERQEEIYNEAERRCIELLTSKEKGEILPDGIDPQSYRAGFMDGSAWSDDTWKKDVESYKRVYKKLFGESAVLYWKNAIEAWCEQQISDFKEKML